MKNTKKITFCGLLSALAAVAMLLSYIPYLTYSAPAIAGVFMMVIAIELPKKWAYGSYVASSVLIALMAENEAKILYIIFFGFYPILKGTLERLRSRPVEYVCKFAIFNAAMAAEIAASVYILGIPLETGTMGAVFYAAFAVLANLFFFLYDFALTKLVGFYVVRLHPRVRRLF